MDEFIRHGGYLGLLERLKEMLDVEWREEQHDDQMLNAILGCFVALTTSTVRPRFRPKSPTNIPSLSVWKASSSISSTHPLRLIRRPPLLRETTR